MMRMAVVLLLAGRWPPRNATVAGHSVVSHTRARHLTTARGKRSCRRAHCISIQGCWSTPGGDAAPAGSTDVAAFNTTRRAVLVWPEGRPRTVLIVKKPRDARATRYLLEIGAWLEEKGLQVLVEKDVVEEAPHLRCFQDHAGGIDFCITLGGDGTVLYLTTLLRPGTPLPPVLSFSMGSLGFLTPFDVVDYPQLLSKVLHTNQEPLSCTMRMRMRCEVAWNGQIVRRHQVLNECSISRGNSPSLAHLECFIDGEFVTTVHADGLIIATPSGSTAYSMSAGGPMVAPSVASTLLTPIAPLSLSFRPLIIPESSEIIVHVPDNCPEAPRASFDGRQGMQLQRGAFLRFTAAQCPLPVINMHRLDHDWYESITSKLGWNKNLRASLQAFSEEVEMPPEQPSWPPRHPPPPPHASTVWAAAHAPTPCPDSAPHCDLDAHRIRGKSAEQRRRAAMRAAATARAVPCQHPAVRQVDLG